MRWKSWFLVGLALAAGIGLGVAVAKARLWAHAWAGPPVVEEGANAAQAMPLSGPQPKVLVVDPVYDFGAMDLSEKGKHVFVVRNVGDGPLKVSTGKTSCKCTLSRVNNEPVPPGGEEHVTVEWHAVALDDNFEQRAHLTTSDPAQPEIELTIKGRITAALRVVPSKLDMGRIVAGEPSKGLVRLYGYVEQPLKINRSDFTDPTTSSYFDVTITPLSSDQLKEEKGAQSGLAAEVTVKPGLPLGRFRQTIQWKTNLLKAPKAELEIGGRVASEVSLAGKDWSPEEGILKLGTFTSREGIERILVLVAGGMEGEKIHYELEEVQPELLKVALGQTTPLEGGKLLTRLTISVPPGSRSGSYLGPELADYGRIVLKTNHPRAPKLQIYVKFAVEGSPQL